LIAATVAVVLVATAVLALAGGDDDAEAGPDPATVARLSLKPLDGGGEQRLGDLLDAGKPVVLNMFASWCQPCIEEMPGFEHVHQQLGGEVTFAGLAIRNPADKALALVQQTGVTYPTFADTGDAGAELFDLVNMPTTIFIDADGNVVERRAGRITEDQLRDEIDEQFGVHA
jgi:thiol-disulfide isomerase/thioredoxin